MTALLKVGPWALVVLAAAGWVRSYGNERAAEALAVARADSIVWALARHDSLELNRDAVRLELEAAVQEHDVVRDSLVLVADSAESRSTVNLGRLAAILADTSAAAAIPDTIRIVVREAIAGLETERNVCQAQLRTCAATRILLETRIRVDSLSIAEKDSLLVAFDAQLADAIADRRSSCGVLCWGTRGAALYGIVALVANFAGGS